MQQYFEVKCTEVLLSVFVWLSVVVLVRWCLVLFVKYQVVVVIYTFGRKKKTRGVFDRCRCMTHYYADDTITLSGVCPNNNKNNTDLRCFHYGV